MKKRKFYVGQFVYLYSINDAAKDKKVSERIKTCEVLYVQAGKKYHSPTGRINI